MLSLPSPAPPYLRKLFLQLQLRLLPPSQRPGLMIWTLHFRPSDLQLHRLPALPLMHPVLSHLLRFLTRSPHLEYLSLGYVSEAYSSFKVWLKYHFFQKLLTHQDLALSLHSGNMFFCHHYDSKSHIVTTAHTSVTSQAPKDCVLRSL